MAFVPAHAGSPCFVRGGRYGADGFAWKALRVTILHTKLHWEILDAGVTSQARWIGGGVFMCVMVF